MIWVPWQVTLTSIDQGKEALGRDSIDVVRVSHPRPVRNPFDHGVMKPVAVPLVVGVGESHCLAGFPRAEFKQPVVWAGDADPLGSLSCRSVRHSEYKPRPPTTISTVTPKEWLASSLRKSLRVASFTRAGAQCVAP